MTRTSFLRMIKASIAVLIAVIIIAYAIWRSLNYARGPAIEISQPADGASITASTTLIAGKADRLSSLALNGMAISTDEQGNFSETIIIFPGINAITLSGTDQFGRTTQKELRLMGLTR